MKKEVVINVRVTGAKQMQKSVDGLTKSLKEYFAIGKKFKMPKSLLLRMIEWQVERKQTVKPVDPTKLKYK